MVVPPEFEPLSTNSLAHFIDFDTALDFAEQAGMRLPTEDEYLFAATKGGELFYPWCDDSSVHDCELDHKKMWGWDVQKLDRQKYALLGHEDVVGLYSGLAEWTLSRNTPVLRPGTKLPPALKDLYASSFVIRGAPSAIVQNRPGIPITQAVPHARSNNHGGFRSESVGFRYRPLPVRIFVPAQKTLFPLRCRIGPVQDE